MKKFITDNIAAVMMVVMAIAIASLVLSIVTRKRQLTVNVNAVPTQSTEPAKKSNQEETATEE